MDVWLCMYVPIHRGSSGGTDQDKGPSGSGSLLDNGLKFIAVDRHLVPNEKTPTQLYTSINIMVGLSV